MYHIKWAKTNDKAVIPKKNNDDAGWDVYACIDEDVKISPGEVVMIPTAIKYQITEGWHLIAKERGSAAKINLKTSAGVNDNSFRGSVNAFLYNGNLSRPIILSVNEEKTKQNYKYDKHVIIYPIIKAIQQLVPVYSPNGTCEIVDESELSETNRGDGMTGSSGN
jgi:dUTP pyrophosphatase